MRTLKVLIDGLAFPEGPRWHDGKFVFSDMHVSSGSTSSSGIWKERFLSLYDFPSIDSYYDFCTGYQLRRFVLRNFPDCAKSGREAEIGMEVLRDMVLGMCHALSLTQVNALRVILCW